MNSLIGSKQQLKGNAIRKRKPMKIKEESLLYLKGAVTQIRREPV